jgi:hypothetical protein
MSVQRKMNRRDSRRGRGNVGSDPESFLKNAWAFFKNEYLANAPAELVETFNSTGLRLPKDEHDVMRAPFVVLAKYVPSALVSADILARKSDATTRAKTGVLLTILSHPKWRHARLLLEVLASNDRMKKLQKDRPDDWQYWVLFLFNVIELIVRRMFSDVRTVIDEELSGDVGDLMAERAAKLLPDNLIDTDEELNDIATEEYRRALFEWDNDDDRPPFTKHDIWMALMDDSEPEDHLPSPSALVDLRAARVTENYGLSRRDARLVVAVIESLGKTINLKDDEDEDEEPSN